MSDRGADEPTELIYSPTSSWAPALIAAGLAGVLAGLFTWWPYAIVGALVALVALKAWVSGARGEFGRLPRRQRLTSAPIPAAPLRRSDNS